MGGISQAHVATIATASGPGQGGRRHGEAHKLPQNRDFRGPGATLTVEDPVLVGHGVHRHVGRLALWAALLAGTGCGTAAAAVGAEIPPDSIAASWSVGVPAQAAVVARPDGSADAGPGRAEARAPTGDEGAMVLAAEALAFERPVEALDLLLELPEPEEGTAQWFRLGVLRGRAHMMRGDHPSAVRELEPRLDHKKVARHVPPEVIGLELARAQLAWADRPEVDTQRADDLRKQAARRLGKLQRLRPIRTLARLRVEQAHALAQVQGHDKKSRFWAGKKAKAAIDRVLRDYPGYPRIGELRLERARAIERMGDPRAAAAAFREVAIERAGEPEAAQAWTELERLASEHGRIKLRPWSTKETLARAKWARRHRRMKESRKLLDDVLADASVPSYLRKQARSSRAQTAYKQRDYATCASDRRQLYQSSGSYEIRDELLRCLERGRQYDEAIDIWLRRAKKKKGGDRKHAIWNALEMAFKGGQYQRAYELLERYEKLSRGHHGERRFLHAWLAYRLGKRDEAVEAFETLEKRSRGRATMAKYFRGKLLVGFEDPERRQEGERLLRALMDAEPLGYYGLQARQRLLDAGLDPGELPKLAPLPDEDERPDYLAAHMLFTTLSDEYGEAWPALRRASQLHAVGHLEGARRELRVAVDTYRRGKTRGGKMSQPRNEALIVGLGWKREWSYPKFFPTREGRKTLRSRESAEQLREGMRTLALAVDEPHRYVKLTPASKFAFKSRWHPRAFRGVVEREATRRELDPTHMWALMYTESRFRRFVVSPVGARGALQIMPWTARQLAERLDELDEGRFDVDRLYDIDDNAKLSAYYVSELMHKFHGQPAMAYASYNGGPSNVARWLTAKSNGPYPLDLDTFIEEIVFSETYRYTKRVLEVQAAYALLYRGQLPRWTNAVDTVVEDNIDF